MTFEIKVVPDLESLQEIPSLGDADLEEYISALLTCSVELTLDGESLLRDPLSRMPHPGKLNAQGFNGIVCVEFLSELLRAAMSLYEGSPKETVSLTASRYSLELERDNHLVRITVEDSEFRSFHLGQFPLEEFRLAALVAAKATVEALARANPGTTRLQQVSEVAAMIASLVE